VFTSLPVALPINPAPGNGTRYRVLTRAAATSGESYSVEIMCRGSVGGFSSELPCSLPGHVHMSQDETVAVSAGRLGWIKGQQRGLLQAGESLLIEKGEQQPASCVGFPCGALFRRCCRER
jgi:hypothetical protein